MSMYRYHLQWGRVPMDGIRHHYNYVVNIIQEHVTKINIYCILYYKLLLNLQATIVLQRYTKHISFYPFSCITSVCLFIYY